MELSQNVMQFLRPVNEGTYLYTVAAAWIGTRS